MRLGLAHFQQVRKLGVGRRIAISSVLEQLQGNYDVLGLEHFRQSHYGIRDSRMSNENSNSSKGSEPWQRLWLPSETWERHRGIDEEFLSDYGGLGGVDHFMEDALPGVAGLANFSDRALLIMLGRPGAGKSKELEIAEKEDWFGENAIFIQGKTLGASDPAIYFRTVYGEKLNDPTHSVQETCIKLFVQDAGFVPA